MAISFDCCLFFTGQINSQVTSFVFVVSFLVHGYFISKTYKKAVFLQTLIIEIVEELAIIFEADTEIIMEKILADNQVIKKCLIL